MVNFCISIQSINKMTGLHLFILCNFKLTVVINLYGLFVVGLTCKNVVKQQFYTTSSAHLASSFNVL